MAEDLMRYDQMAREALRGVVRAALHRAADTGLPGEHHFYITFKTRAPGVDLDEELMERHPAEMTIVLEHQFWDLAVDEDAFEVTLKFNRIPKYLRVPFDAVVQFQDPSVGFALRFDLPAGQPAPEKKTGRTPGLPTARAEPQPPARARGGDGGKPAPRLKVKPEDPPPSGAGGQVVDLDKFRKKSD